MMNVQLKLVWCEKLLSEAGGWKKEGCCQIFSEGKIPSILSPSLIVFWSKAQLLCLLRPPQLTRLGILPSSGVKGHVCKEHADFHSASKSVENGQRRFDLCYGLFTFLKMLRKQISHCSSVVLHLPAAWWNSWIYIAQNALAERPRLNFTAERSLMKSLLLL